jgi:hypothetical protein
MSSTLGSGIFRAMANAGSSFGPTVAARLGSISWDSAFRSRRSRSR